MKSIRCGRGLGDSIYLQSVVRHLVRTTGERYSVCSDYPDVFIPLGDSVQVVPFRRDRVNITAHYVARKGVQGTTQFDDCCQAARIEGPVELKLDWPGPSGQLVEQLRREGKPIVCVQMMRYPMGREDGFGMDMLPDPKMIQQFIDGVRDIATVVQIGAGKALHSFDGVNIDLSGKTTVKELIDVVAVSSGCLGYCSFLLPLAESLDKPLQLVWARRGLSSSHPFIRMVTPRKLLHKPSSMWIMDDAQEDRVRDGIEEMRRLLTMEHECVL